MGSCVDDGLVLRLGFSTTTTTKPKITKPCFNFDHLLNHHETMTSSSTPPPPPLVEPSLSLSLSSDQYHHLFFNNNFSKKVDAVKKSCSGGDDRHRPASPQSTVSSFSGGGGGTVRIKKERDLSNCSEEIEVDRGVSNSRMIDEDEDGFNARKKLRLTKDQSALLEESFKQNSTLNPKQKQALAWQLNLRPRQVEVWFQNRRARTKLKQTEVDCEFLKKCCETLAGENRRLQKELQELKAMKPLYVQMPPGSLTICPSCERIGDVSANNGSSTTTTASPMTTSLISLAPKPHTFYNPFSNSPPAC